MGFPSSFSNDIVQIQYNSMGGTLQHGREGKALHIMHITLPNNVQIQINRWNEPNEGSYVNVKIMMPKQPGQDGHCGNFNGNQVDDDRLQIRARVGTTGIAAGELIGFHTKTAVVQVNRRYQRLRSIKVGWGKGTVQEKGAQVHPINGLLG